MQVWTELQEAIIQTFWFALPSETLGDIAIFLQYDLCRAHFISQLDTNAGLRVGLADL